MSCGELELAAGSLKWLQSGTRLSGVVCARVTQRSVYCELGTPGEKKHKPNKHTWVLRDPQAWCLSDGVVGEERVKLLALSCSQLTERSVQME